MTDTAKTKTFPFPAPLPLALAITALAGAALFIAICLQGRYSFTALMVIGLPALLCATTALALGLLVIKKRPAGAPYGFAMGGSLLGGFALVFWFVMVPLMFLIMLPAMEADPPDRDIAVSQKRMRILIRQIKAFHFQYERMPHRLEELVEANLTQRRNLFDPRDTLRDQPSYRIILREMPPEDEWPDTPVLEGRWPDEDGNRLLGFLDEHIGTIR